MYSIYVLELEGNRYYVGKTKDTNSRIKRHFKGYGAEYTKKFKPVKIEKIYYNCEEELKYTLEYMEKYGIDNVRGGPFVKLSLPKEYIITIKQMITSEQNRCFNCGETGHYVRECSLRNKEKAKKINFYLRVKNYIMYLVKYINFYSVS